MINMILKKGLFIALFTKRLIDTIDLRKKEYKNDEIFNLPKEVSQNYYKVINLKKIKAFKFTFERKDNLYGKENPYIICNNNTNEYTDNVTSYDFVKGNNCTIFIHYLSAGQPDSKYYYYPPFRFYDEFYDDSE